MKGASNMSDAQLRLENVSFSIDQQTLLAPISLELPASGMLGLVGQNGSGKSTLLKLIARQHLPSSGSLYINERPFVSWSDREFAQQVAFLPQVTPPAPGVSAREIVEMGRYPWHGALGRFTPNDQQQVHEAMMATQTQQYADRLLDTLSGGERQRVWLAMLIAQQAKTFLLDEPISALDPAHQIGVIRLIREFAQAKGAFVIVVLHDINLAAQFCDRILALKSGRVVAHTTAEEFLNADQLEAVYDVPMGTLVHPETQQTIAFVRG